jgi:nondiscriminating aspartyl-tRNA synthetase
MERFTTTRIPGHVGERVTIGGWLHRLRELSNVSFLVVRDGYGLAQVVINDAATLEQVRSLPNESVLLVHGTVVSELAAPNGVEIHAPEIEVLSAAAEAPPFDLYRPKLNAQLPTMLDHAPVALRHPAKRATFRISAALASGFRTTLQTEGFTEIQTPKIVASATESGANVFELDYFGTPAYLAQSPQFYKQMMVGVFERVFEVGPVFRAEPHDTTRHLNQYTSLDAEMGFIEDHHTVMRMLRSTIAGMLDAVRAEAGQALALLKIELPEVPAEIPAVHFSDALEMVSEALGEDVRHEPDLAPAHERWLGEWAQREHGSDFVFVEGYPMVKRPFYTHPDPARPEYSNSFDLLFRGLELVTGGQRLHRYDDYLSALHKRGQSVEPVESYIRAFKYGMPPHGGFAIGLERFTAQITGAGNVRETTLFPRDLTRLTP